MVFEIRLQFWVVYNNNIIIMPHNNVKHLSPNCQAELNVITIVCARVTILLPSNNIITIILFLRATFNSKILLNLMSSYVTATQLWFPTNV